MAVVVIQEFEATVDAVRPGEREARRGDEPARGPDRPHRLDQGGDRMKVVDVWESADAFRKFVQEAG